MKIGIFGGSFNPPHMGHLNCLQTVQKRLGLDKVILVPTSQNPLKPQIEGPSAEHRLELTRLAFQSWGPQFEVSDLEIKKSGKSYSVDTLKALRKAHPDDELFFILGADSFSSFSEWKNPAELLKLANWVVTSRPGFDFPDTPEDLPPVIQEEVADFDFNFAELKTGRSIQFIRLQDVDISATQLRKWLRVGKNVEKYIPLSVESYIKAHRLYQPLGNKIGDYKTFTEFCGQVLFDRKAINVKGFDLRQISTPAEFTLVASGTSTKHAASLAENVIVAVKEEFNVFPQSIEGVDEGRWVVVDYGSVIIHVFYDFVRQEYSLENLWRDAIDLGLKDTSATK